jgi:hypothetical protein
VLCMLISWSGLQRTVLVRCAASGSYGWSVLEGSSLSFTASSLPRLVFSTSIPVVSLSVLALTEAIDHGKGTGIVCIVRGQGF